MGRRKLDAIESGDREKLLKLYMENSEMFTEDEIAEYELEEMKREWGAMEQHDNSNSLGNKTEGR
jgi:hypothetical protein